MGKSSCKSCTGGKTTTSTGSTSSTECKTSNPATRTACNAPTNIVVDSSGKITWNVSSNCKSAWYELKIDGTYIGQYKNTSGTSKLYIDNLHDKIVAKKGTRTITKSRAYNS